MRRWLVVMGGACLVPGLACSPVIPIVDDGECTASIDAPEVAEISPGDPEPLDGGRWLVDGDILVDDLAEGRAIAGARAGELSFRSAALCGGEVDRAWDVARKLDLSYCFAGFTDAALRTRAGEAIAVATAQWERAGGINFVHRAELDDTAACTSPDAVAFAVRQGSEAYCGESCPLGAASFPPTGTRAAEPVLLLWSEALTSDRYALEMVILHELGHMLGLVHEHSRFSQEREVCVDAASTQWRGLTFADADSVMGDARCPGISRASTQGRLSAGDRLGLHTLYTLPRAAALRFDDDAAEDLFWFMPGGSSYAVWYGGGAGSIAFVRAEHSACRARTGDCPARLPRAWKPIAREGAAGRSEVLMFGPRAIADERWRPGRRGARFARDAVAADFSAVPLVGRFAGEEGEDVWWLRPGPGVDPLWDFAADGSIRAALPAAGFAGGYGWPLVGLWDPSRGSGAPRSQVLWLDAESPAVRVWSAGQGASDMSESTELPACGLQRGEERAGLAGDFDGDGVDEALWWAPRAQTAVRWRPASLWTEEGTCAEGQAPVLAGAGGRTARPAVGDFDGDGADDVLWVDDAAPETAWRLVEATPEVVRLPEVGVDATPCVGDFDGDGCDDVLWFAPHQATSPLWRARCEGALGFTAQPPVVHPAGAYPVGCGG